MLYISCSTFNHVGYIQDAMNGFAMQQTTFPFVAVIMDDASTDGTADVIRQYLKDHFDLDDKDVVRHEDTDDYTMTSARHKENKNCFFAVYLLKYNHYSIKKAKSYAKEWTEGAKYYAICEGDDYWTRPEKLQTQVDFLESHPDYSMCFHDVDIKVEAGRDATEKDKFSFLREGEYTKEDQLRLMRIVPTCSIVMPVSIIKQYPNNSKFTIGDVVVVATALTHGKIWCIGSKMGVYRLVPTGWTAMSDERICRSMFSHYQGMIESFDWYKCKKGYDTLKFWAFSLLTMLKDNHNTADFNKYAKEYKEFFHVSTLSEFYIYYYNHKFRAILRGIFGQKFTSKVKKLLTHTS